MPNAKTKRCESCDKWTTARRCRECLELDGDGLTEAELEAMIAAQRPTMPLESVVKSYGSDRTRAGEREPEGYRPPESRFCRMARRWNGRRF